MSGDVGDAELMMPAAASPSRRRPKNFTFEENSTRGSSPHRYHKQKSPHNELSVKSPESVISPSKMKKRSSTRSNKSTNTKLKIPAERDSRDDVVVGRGDRSRRSPALKVGNKEVSPSLHKSEKVEHVGSSPDYSQSKSAQELESMKTARRKKLMNNLREPDQNIRELTDVLLNEGTSNPRRVNACGAIKTLTLSKSNQIPLARTKGVVASITSVLCQVDATEEERTRCINALMHLCVPEQNWRLVYLFPETPQALARNMADRYPQIRYAACLALSFLAKKNRRDIVDNKILMYSIARVLEVDRKGILNRFCVQDRKVFINSRMCALKMLLHLSKNRDVSEKLGRAECITSSLIQIASTMEVAANILCIAIITNLTRLPDNAAHLVFSAPGLVPVLVHATESADQEICKCALYAIQNLACAGSARQELANTPNLLGSVTKNAFKTQFPEQQLSALHTLKNLSDDPFNLVTMTNTPGCTATLLALANDSSNNMAQFLACDTLATLSHWLLTLSAAKKSKIKHNDPNVGRRTFQISTWEMWN